MFVSCTFRIVCCCTRICVMSFCKHVSLCVRVCESNFERGFMSKPQNLCGFEFPSDTRQKVRDLSARYVRCVTGKLHFVYIRNNMHNAHHIIFIVIIAVVLPTRIARRLCVHVESVWALENWFMLLFAVISFSSSCRFVSFLSENLFSHIRAHTTRPFTRTHSTRLSSKHIPYIYSWCTGKFVVLFVMFNIDIFTYEITHIHFSTFHSSFCACVCLSHSVNDFATS